MAITGSAKQLKGASRKIHYGGSAVCHRFKVCMIAAFSNRDAGGFNQSQSAPITGREFFGGTF